MKRILTSIIMCFVADATESRIGKRIGFVFNDSVITAPTVNCRIESGGFSINSPDKALIIKFFNSLKYSQNNNYHIDSESGKLVVEQYKLNHVNKY